MPENNESRCSMSMTPDKTLEELVTAVVNAAFECGEYDGDDVNYTPVLDKSRAAKKALFDYFQTATAAQQREMERLSEQLRTEREKYRELFMKAQDLVKELKSE